MSPSHPDRGAPGEPVVYLDHAATTPPDPRVVADMEPWLAAEFGNPSSAHAAGIRAAEALDAARVSLARATGSRPGDVVFVAGGTEANNLAVLGLARARRASARKGVVVGPTEHPCVREAAEALAREGFEVSRARLDARGCLDLDHFAGLLDDRTVLVAQMLVQNEWGSVYPVRALADRVRARAPRAHVHVDAVQALGKLDVSLAELGADSVALSAHKVGGPKGVGALVLAPDSTRPRPLVFGGGQEHGLRSGTENVAGIVGFGRAVEIAESELDATAARLAALREALRAGLGRIAGARPIEPRGAGTRPSDAIASVRVPGLPAEVRLHHLDARGVRVSAGAACQARKGGVSPSFAALGMDDAAAREVLRISFGPCTTLEEIALLLDRWCAVEAELEALRP